MSTEKSEFPLVFRIWHWLNFVAISGLLGTFFLRKTFLNYRTNREIIREKISAAGQKISSELAESVAKAIRDPMWEWHILFGYTLAFLMIFRLIVFFLKIKSGSAHRYAPAEKKIMKLSYAGFYICASFMSVTGLLMVFKAQWGISKNVISVAKDSHEIVMWAVLLFVILHLSGVLFSEFREKTRGLISRMISGT